MADKKARIKKLKTPAGVLACMQVAHLGKIIAIPAIACAVLDVFSLFGAIFIPFLYIFAWLGTIILAGIPLLFEWGRMLLDSEFPHAVAELVVDIAQTIGVVGSILCGISIICMLAARNKNYPLIIGVAVAFVICLLFACIGGGTL